MATLHNLRCVANSAIATCVDDDTPAGHFQATAQVLGRTRTYLLAGDLNDPQAPIVGRLEHATGDIVRGTRLLGGDWLGTAASTADAFARITEH